MIVKGNNWRNTFQQSVVAFTSRFADLCLWPRRSDRRTQSPSLIPIQKLRLEGEQGRFRDWPAVVGQVPWPYLPEHLTMKQTKMRWITKIELCALSPVRLRTAS